MRLASAPLLCLHAVMASVTQMPSARSPSTPASSASYSRSASCARSHARYSFIIAATATASIWRRENESNWMLLSY